MSVIINNRHYEDMSCGQCGVVFFVPQNFYNERINDGDGWHCPNGHLRVFTEPKAKTLQKKIEEMDREIVALKTDRITFKGGLENRERELVRLRERLKKLRKKARGA